MTPGGAEDRERELLLRLLDGIKDDVVGVRDSHAALRDKIDEIERYARSSFSRVEAVEDEVARLERKQEKLEADALASTLSIVQIRATARGAGMVAGAVISFLVSLLTAWVLHVLKLI